MTNELSQPFRTPNDTVCVAPPEGWYCTREGGHDGPCAAWPTRPNNQTLYDLAKRYVDAVDWDENHPDACSGDSVDLAFDNLKGHFTPVGGVS